MSTISEAERSISPSEMQILEVERHIQKLEAAEQRARGLHEKIQTVLETKMQVLRSLRSATEDQPHPDG